MMVDPTGYQRPSLKEDPMGYRLVSWMVMQWRQRKSIPMKPSATRHRTQILHRYVPLTLHRTVLDMSSAPGLEHRRQPLDL